MAKYIEEDSDINESFEHYRKSIRLSYEDRKLSTDDIHDKKYHMSKSRL